VLAVYAGSTMYPKVAEEESGPHNWPTDSLVPKYQNSVEVAAGLFSLYQKKLPGDVIRANHLSPRSTTRSLLLTVPYLCGVASRLR